MKQNRSTPEPAGIRSQAHSPEERITNPVDQVQGSTPLPAREGRPTVKFELDIPPAAWAVLVAIILKVLGILPVP